VGFASYNRGINCNWHRSISGTSYGSKGFRTALPLCLLVSNYFVFLLFLLFLKGWHVVMITNHRVMSNAHLQSPCILSLTLSTRQFQQVEVMSTCHDLTTFSTPPFHITFKALGHVYEVLLCGLKNPRSLGMCQLITCYPYFLLYAYM